ncbi:hypothetical protein EC835_105217 [Providencia alcalifaciens]|uniref:Uncharacterized protein n=1 Tax=Providencia alcalifaciens TaxID=126385 RepID=A0A4R3NK12_9GAMM|nr:hypothetical protein EC835_105217 [Providencia alcalifaciens]
MCMFNFAEYLNDFGYMKSFFPLKVIVTVLSGLN